MATINKREQYLSDLPIADKVQGGYSLTKEDVLTEEGLFLVQCLVRDGNTLDKVAEILGIKGQTFWLWRKKYKELEDACARGKQLVDYKVESALLKAALGYKTETVKTYISGTPDSDGNKQTRIEKTVQEVGPNTTACLAWLNNRKPEQWRRNRDNVAEFEDKKSGITINIIKGKGTDDDDWGDDDDK